ncbi:MAG TPA: amidohydrolase family protein [Steroidobacteraceae bacterium]|jgi:imidazolonepropionase-like amidohydrolase|nr:amidohydrolase family protein [Steroidobacteraceae bacterium]
MTSTSSSPTFGRLLRSAGSALALFAASWCGAAPLAITNVRILDGNGGTPIERGTIVVDERRIVAVGDAAQVRIPSGAHRIDGKGGTALPGLSDMHVHLLGGIDGVGLDVLGYQKYLNALLYAGVTTVMDTGNVEPFVLQLRAETRSGRVLGPRIYCVGPILDGADPVWPALSVAIAAKEQVPRIVASLADEKVDFIKLYVGLSDPLVRTISAEAGKHGIRTIIDQWSRNGSADLAQEGIAGFAHFPSHRISDDTIATIKAHNVFLISTLAVQESSLGRRFLDLSFLDNPLIADTTPRRALDTLRKQYGGLTAEQLAQKNGYTMRVDLKGAESNVPRLRDAGVLFTTGTDAIYPGDFQGEGLHRELELLVESGLTPLQAITASTKNAAAIVNASAEWGTLEAGKLATLIVVAGKPDQRIGDTRNIVYVIKEGAVIDRTALRLDHSHIPDYQETGSSMAPVW